MTQKALSGMETSRVESIVFPPLSAETCTPRSLATNAILTRTKRAAQAVLRPASEDFHSALAAEAWELVSRRPAGNTSRVAIRRQSQIPQTPIRKPHRCGFRRVPHARATGGCWMAFRRRVAWCPGRCRQRCRSRRGRCGRRPLGRSQNRFWRWNRHFRQASPTGNQSWYFHPFQPVLARSLVEEPYSGARIESFASGNQYGARCSAFPPLPANAGLWPDQREDSEGVFERGRPLMTWEPSRDAGTHWLAVN